MCLVGKLVYVTYKFTNVENIKFVTRWDDAEFKQRKIFGLYWRPLDYVHTCPAQTWSPFQLFYQITLQVILPELKPISTFNYWTI